MAFSKLGLLAACLLLLGGCQSRVLPGMRAPDFRLVASNGQPLSLSQYRGRVVLVNFWASWCPPCVEETPALNALQNQFPDRSVVVLGISQDQDDAAFQRFLGAYQVRFPTARNPGAAIQLGYGTVQIPETYIIDRRGIVVRKLVSVPEPGWDSPQMIAYLRQLAAAPAAAADYRYRTRLSGVSGALGTTVIPLPSR